LEFFFESGPSEGSALACLLGLHSRTPQNLILVGPVGIGFSLDAGADDHLVGQPTSSELGFDPRAAESVLSLQDGDVSG
jgi:hypothetical protein